MAEDTAPKREGIKSMVAIYPCKNAELRRVALFAYECARNTIMEGASGMTVGAEEHFKKRQLVYVEAMQSRIDNLIGKPIPDHFGMADTPYPINMSAPLNMVTTNVGDEEVPLNEDLQMVTTQWMTLAVLLARSNSAGHKGGLHEHDRDRVNKALEVTKTLITEITASPFPDFAATADPGATREAAE